MDCPFNDEYLMVGSAVLVDDVWHWCIGLGRSGTVVLERCGAWSDKTPRAVTYDQIDSIV